MVLAPVRTKISCGIWRIGDCVGALLLFSGRIAAALYRGEEMGEFLFPVAPQYVGLFYGHSISLLRRWRNSVCGDGLAVVVLVPT